MLIFSTSKFNISNEYWSLNKWLKQYDVEIVMSCYKVPPTVFECNTPCWLLNCVLELSHGRNTPAQTLDVWNVWGDSDEFGNKPVVCVQLCWKLLELRWRCLVRFNLQSLRVSAAWGLDTIGYSDWLCASCAVTILIGGVWEGPKWRW